MQMTTLKALEINAKVNVENKRNELEFLIKVFCDVSSAKQFTKVSKAMVELQILKDEWIDATLAKLDKENETETN